MQSGGGNKSALMRGRLNAAVFPLLCHQLAESVGFQTELRPTAAEFVLFRLSLLAVAFSWDENIKLRVTND